MRKPKIRFKGYTEDWEQRKLGELSEFITKGATPTTYGFEWQTSGIPFFRNDAIKNNQFVYGDYSYISEEANEVLKRSEIRANDILVAITGDIGKVGIIPKNIEKGNINQHTARVRVIKAAVPYFIYQSLCTEGQQRKYQLIKTGLSMPQLSLEQIRETVVLCPSLSEQVKIGEYFARLDHFITLHQRKILYKHRKSKLVWEQRKLGDIAEYRNGKGHEEKQSDYGKYELVNLNSISIDGGLKPSGRFVDEAQDTLLKDDLVMVLSDVGHGDLLGRVALIPENNRFVLNQRVALLRVTDNTDVRFLFSIINANQRYFKREGAGSSQLNISRDSVENFIVDSPTVDEQKKIGTYFDTLDHLITLHQRKCDELKNMKKYMLQNMFE